MPIVFLFVGLSLLYLAGTNKLYAIISIFLADTRKNNSNPTNKR